MKIFEIAEVAKGMYQVGRWKRRWFGLAKPIWEPIFSDNHYHSVSEAVQWIEQWEAYNRKIEEERRQYPQDAGFGYIANDGKFYWLRDGGSAY